MNVDGYDMKFRACDSTGNKLIWVGQCFIPSLPDEDCLARNCCNVTTSVDVPSFGATIPVSQQGVDGENSQNEDFGSIVERGAPETFFEPYFDTEIKYFFSGGRFELNQISDPDNLFLATRACLPLQDFKREIVGEIASNQYYIDDVGTPIYRNKLILGNLIVLVRNAIGPTVLPYIIFPESINCGVKDAVTIISVEPSAGGVNYQYQTTDNIYYYDTDPVGCERTTTATLIGSSAFSFSNNNYLSPYDEFAPSSVQITTKFRPGRNTPEGTIGPDDGDRGNATWTLEYDIEEELWTLHSFDRIENPIYTLVDADPCVGLTKILTRVEGSGDNGCEVSPNTVTITRGCPEDLSYRPRDARIRTQCARTIQRKGCDCQNMPIDERWRSVEKCGSILTAGCEDYGDDVKCRYPKNQLTCSFCGDDDIPCTYEALFGGGIVGTTGLCDIIYNGTDIAASTVTLRQKCRFEGPCDWVAVGPTGDPRDGVVGREPYCLLCAEFTVGSCASNCTWEAVQAGLCPASGKPGLLNPPINILAKWGVSWVLNVAEPATLAYDHPSFGVLVYTTSEDEPFLCDNVNTMYLTAQGNLPDGVMPESICVRPRYSGCGGSMTYDVKSTVYDTVENQIACCDPACGSIGPIPIIVRCCTNFEECSTTFTAQTTLLGKDSPAGPSYLGSCTLHGVLWTGVCYCDGVRWKTDWYCKSPREFFVTTTHTHTCCPLTLSIEYWPDQFGGVKCCPVQECQCCDTSGVDYETLDMSITFPGDCAQDRLPAACTFSRPVTMSLSMVRAGTYPNHVWTVDPILCDPDYGFDMSVSCLDGIWSLSYNFGGGIPAALCNPNSGTLTATNNALCPAILLEWTNPIVCDNSCVLVSNITITS